MATERQRKAAHAIVRNGGNVTKAMIEAGYSENTAHTPQKLTQSTGFLEICEASGLTDRFLLSVLMEDIRNKKGNRRGEIELAFKLKGHIKGTAKNEIEVTNNVGIGIKGVMEKLKAEVEQEERERKELEVIESSTSSQPY